MSIEILETGTNELLCELADGVATVTLNRPEKRNALGDNLTPALRAILLTLEENLRCGAIVITGSGRAFCAGGDVSGMGGAGSKPETQTIKPTPEDGMRALIHKQESLTLRMHELAKPIIAALPGPAAGAGLSIALAADLRVMSEDTFITTAFANIGLSGDYGTSWFLTRLIGPSRALELMLTARRITAKECLDLGIVNTITPYEEVRNRARQLALDIANGPRTALRYMKENINRAVNSDLKTCLSGEARALMQCSRTDDHKEAVRAFMEKRPPIFNNPT